MRLRAVPAAPSASAMNFSLVDHLGDLGRASDEEAYLRVENLSLALLRSLAPTQLLNLAVAAREWRPSMLANRAKTCPHYLRMSNRLVLTLSANGLIRRTVCSRKNVPCSHYLRMRFRSNSSNLSL